MVNAESWVGDILAAKAETSAGVKFETWEALIAETVAVVRDCNRPVVLANDSSVLSDKPKACAVVIAATWLVLSLPAVAPSMLLSVLTVRDAISLVPRASI